MTRDDEAEVILAIDQGTTGTKALILDTNLDVLAEETVDFPQHFPSPGLVEHEPAEIVASVELATARAIAAARLSASQIRAIGITNQRETTVVWDAHSGRPIHRAIVWQDRRTTDLCAELERQGHGEEFRAKTGLLLDPYFSGTKIRWILDNVSGARELANAGRLRFGTIDTFLTWRLTNGAAHVTDISNASRTLIMDLESGAWDPELADRLGVPIAMLPEIRDNDRVFATTKNAGFLPDGIPIGALIGDQQSALFGQACFSPGEAKCTYGTGAFLVMNTGKKIARSKRGLLSTAAWRIGGETCYALEGSSFVAGAVVQWLRDGLGIIERSADVEALAASVPSSEGVSFVPAFAGLGAPHWDPNARGLICGLTRGTTKAHIARAAIEGIAFQIHDILDAMQQDLGHRLHELKVDGGASRNDLLLQFQADLLGVDTIRPSITSTTALGAALQAGLTVGLFGSIPDLRKTWREERRARPRMDRKEAAERVERWSIAVRRARG
jgi:glycerol kinase